MRKRIRILGAAALLAALAATLLGTLSTRASAQGQAVDQKVIVVFNNQDRAQPATRGQLRNRRASFHSTQAPILSQLNSTGATNVQSYSVLDAVSATVSSSEASQLKSDPAVQAVVPDQIIHLAPTQTIGSASGASASGASAVCSAGKPQLNPEALGTIHANSDIPGAPTAAKQGIDGSGVKVAFIADGLDINNPDFIRPDGQPVFIDYKDFSGEGTSVPTGGEEAFGDASSIAAQGRETYNVANYGPDAVKSTCNIRVEGVAPGASLVGLDIFGAEDAGYNSTFLDAINYAVTTDHVNVLNESLGNNTYPDDPATLDLIKQANDAAVAAGTTVTVSSGDAGSSSTIGTPSTDPNVISAGATTTYRVNLQDGYGGAQFPGVTGYLDNDISSFSSSGFEQDGRTVDVVAPGELNWALCSTDIAMYADCTNYSGKPTPVVPFGGTSESAPLTAGVAALVDQAYDKTHGTYPTPAVVKQIITSTADDIASPADQQGAGLVDAFKAVKAAESYQAPASSPPATGFTVLKSSDQLNAVDQPGTPETLTDTITNSGPRSQTIAVSSRTLGAYQTIKTSTVTLSDASSPKTTDWSGTQANYEPITFTVTAGQDRLDASLAFQNASTTDLAARVRLTLVDPSGDLAAYSVPQGDGNHGDVQVTNPKPGTWTAYVWSRTAANGGTTGPVLFGAQVADYTTFGAVSPSTLTLAPGQSAPVTLSVSTPSTSGDTSGSLVFTSNRGAGFARQTTVPVTLRSLIPAGPQSFQQTLTGGNGRSTITGQTFYYQLDVAAGTPELNAAINLADNPNNPFTAFLVSPSGEALATQSNELTSNSGFTNQLGAQLHVLSPVQGAWTLIVAFIPQVSGTTLSEPFTVSTNESPVPASATGLPDSASTTLAAGTPQTYTVKVLNNGPAPEDYFLDARLATSTQLPLTSLTSPSTTVPLNFNENVPVYLVPTNSTALYATASTTGTEPIQFDTEAPTGDPDIKSSQGLTATSSFDANPLAPGLWDIAPDVTGAYGATGAASEPVTTSMDVTTATFDSTVSSATGDLWLASTNPDELNSLSPVVVGPGQTGQIPVTITPKGAPGTTVTGTLYVDDESDLVFQNYDEPNGDQVTAIPYSYTIK